MDQEQQNVKVEIVQPQKSGLATAALVIGIIGVCLSFIPIVNNAAFVLGVLAIALAIFPLIKKRSIGKAVSGIVLGVLAIAITLVMQAAMLNAVDEVIDDLDDAIDDLEDDLAYMDGEKTNEILENFLDVNIGTFEVTEDEYWSESKLTVTLKNKGDKASSFNVTIEAVDATGNRIELDYIYASELGAGQSQSFDVFDLIDSAKYEAMKQATFRVVEVSMY